MIRMVELFKIWIRFLPQNSARVFCFCKLYNFSLSPSVYEFAKLFSLTFFKWFVAVKLRVNCVIAVIRHHVHPLEKFCQYYSSIPCAIKCQPLEILPAIDLSFPKAMLLLLCTLRGQKQDCFPYQIFRI